MELIKADKPLEYKYKDVVFYVRPNATGRDKLELFAASEVVNGKTIMRKKEFMHALLQSFVLDWSGVTENGKPVPYSIELLMDRFPVGDPSDSPIIGLVAFIIDKTNVVPRIVEEKNGSRRQSNGAAK